MATTYKILGQLLSNSAAITNVYSVPVSTSTVISTIVICNQNTSTNATFRIAVVPSGNTLSAKHYINYDTSIPSSDSVALTMGVTLAANDYIQANASSNTVSFTIFGTEVT